MKRREFISLLGGAAALAARGARAAGRADAAHWHAHARSRRRCGISSPRWGVPAGPAAIGLDHRPQCADRYPLGRDDADEIRRHAAELAALAPDAILASSSPAVAALQQATRTVPIVFVIVVDPVGAGFVDSLARPGGNTTGFMLFEYSLSGKWLELLKQIAPSVTRVAVLSRYQQSFRDRPVRRHPGRGAVARDRGEPGQHARRQRDRSRHRGLRALGRMAV